MLPVAVKENFLCFLMEGGSVSDATRRLGINRMTPYLWREDPEYARRWDAALDIARGRLREQVVETASEMGLGKWVQVFDPDTGEVILDEDFEPVMQLDTSHVDARVLMKMMDKVVRSEDGNGGTKVEVNNMMSVRLPERPSLVRPEPDDIPDAQYEEVEDGS